MIRPMRRPLQYGLAATVWTYAATVWFLLPIVLGLNVLVVPMPGDNSPVLDMMAVAAQLQSRGHQITVVADPAAEKYAKMAAVRHSSNTTAEAMHYVHMPHNASSSLDAMIANVSEKFKASFSQSKLAGLMLLLQLQEFLAKPCRSILENEPVMLHLRELRADAVIALSLPGSEPSNDNCGCLLSHALGVPMVIVNGNPLLQGPLNLPQRGSSLTPADLRSLKGWAKNFAVWSVKRLLPLVIEVVGSPWKKLRHDLQLPRARSSCLLANLPAWVRGRKSEKCEAVVEVLLTSWLLEYARPLAPNQVLVGPGTPRPAHPISPPEVADFVDSAPAGVVLMAIGTTPQAKLVLTPKDFIELAEGFALLAPTRVLWAMKQRALPDGMQLADIPIADNVMLVPWVDYNDVLGHPNIRAFVSHCGWHSVCEAAYHGVPVVGFPFQFEQAENVGRLVERGMAVIMPNAAAMRQGSNVTFERQQVADTIRKVVSDPSYAAAAQGMSAALQAYSKHRHPYERAADEIELAINVRHAQQQQQQQQHGVQTSNPPSSSGSKAGQHLEEQEL